MDLCYFYIFTSTQPKLQTSCPILRYSRPRNLPASLQKEMLNAPLHLLRTIFNEKLKWCIYFHYDVPTVPIIQEPLPSLDVVQLLPSTRACTRTGEFS